MAIDRPPQTGLPQDRPQLQPGHGHKQRAVRLSILEVMGDAWKLYSKFLGRFFVIAAVVFGLLSLIQFATDETREFGLLAVLIAATVVGTFWLHGALVIAVDDARRKRPTLSIVGVFRSVTPYLWTLIGAGLLVAAGVTVGLLFLIVPGLVLLTVWSMTAPAIVLERKSIRGALARSWELVKPDALRVFAVIAITVLVATAISTVIRALLRPLPDAIDTYVATVVASAVVVPYVLLVWTVMYFELKLNSETNTSA